MRTSLFEWAKEEGLTHKELAQKLGYSERQLYRIRDGHWPVSEAFMARVVLKLGNWARSLFFDEVSLKTDKTSVLERESHDDSEQSQEGDK